MKEFNTKEYYELALKLTEELCKIPAPSGIEDKRAEYIVKYLHKIGFNNAYIDNAKNVIWEIKGNTKDYALFTAHTDTVFPDLEPMPYFDDGIYIKCPGVCDDTVCVAIILAYSKYLSEINFKPKKSILFSANSCEEGLGNLKGIRQIFNDYLGKISMMISLDSPYTQFYNSSVGSHRFLVAVETDGGHSYTEFGNENAILIMSKIVNKIYEIEVPKKEGAKTTYNVGVMYGGTSVNTIAQKAEMLCEYRSNDDESFKLMENKFNEIFEQTKKEFISAKIDVKLVGDRPAMGYIDKEKMEALSKLVKESQEKFVKAEVIGGPASTDCNIPHSLSIPAVCLGVYKGAGVHTREEYLEKESVKIGLDIFNDVILKISNNLIWIDRMYKK